MKRSETWLLAGRVQRGDASENAHAGLMAVLQGVLRCSIERTPFIGERATARAIDVIAFSSVDSPGAA